MGQSIYARSNLKQGVKQLFYLGKHIWSQLKGMGFSISGVVLVQPALPGRECTETEGVGIWCSSTDSFRKVCPVLSIRNLRKSLRSENLRKTPHDHPPMGELSNSTLKIFTTAAILVGLYIFEFNLAKPAEAPQQIQVQKLKTASHWGAVFHIIDSRPSAHAMKHWREEHECSGGREEKEAEVAATSTTQFLEGVE